MKFELRDIFNRNHLILGIVVGANFVAQALQYVTQIFLSRNMDVGHFGIYNTVIAFSAIILFFAPIVPMIVSKVYINDELEKEKIFPYLFRSLVKITIIVDLLILVLYDPILAYLKSPDLLILGTLLLAVPPTAIGAFLFGLLQGAFRYRMIIIYSLIYPVIRLTLSYVFIIEIPLNYHGALLAHVAGLVTSLLFLLYLFKSFFREAHHETFSTMKESLRPLFKQNYPILIYYLIFTAMGSLDVTVINFFLSEYESGLFSGIAIIAKIIFFVNSTVIFLLFPEFVKKSKDDQQALKFLVLVLGVTFLFSVGYILGIHFFDDEIITLLIGAKFLVAKDIIIVLCIATGLLSLLNVVFNYLISKETYIFIIPTAIVFIAAVLSIVFKFHDSTLEIVRVLLAAYSLIFVTSFTFLFYGKRGAS